MTRMLEWLLGLERIRLDADAPLSVRFSAPPAAWIQLGGFVLAVLAIIWIYRREPATGRWRWLLASARLGVVLLVLGLAARPMLVLRRTHVEPSVVAVLIDQSASMSVKDARFAVSSDDGASGDRRSRWDGALDALTREDGGLLTTLLATHHVDVWSFAGSPEHAGSVRDAGDMAALRRVLAADKPAAPATQVGASLTQVLDRMQGRRLAGVFVIGDGRETGGDGLDAAAARAAAGDVAVHTVLVGSTRPRRDVRVSTVRVDEHAFVNDLVRVEAGVRVDGFDEPEDVEFCLRDAATGERLAARRERIGGTDSERRIEFQYRPSRGGRRTLRVEAVAPRGDANADNDACEAVLEVHDEKIGVLYVEDRPRFEYRYLKNMLTRERSIESSCLLLDADADFAQEGSRPVRAFPNSVEELRQYDVVVLGDVDPRAGWLSQAQTEMLVNFVSLDGGGLAFIAGERNMPGRLRDTPLERLLPVILDPAFSERRSAPLDEPYRLQLTADGRDSPVFRVELDPAANLDTLERLPGWYWFAGVQGAAPAAAVLAQHPSVTTPAGPLPLVVLGRHGAGRTFFVGSDDVWRWRRYHGEAYYENLWLQVIRTLARGRRLGADRPWRLDADRREYAFGEQVRLQLTASDPAAAGLLREIVVDVRDAFAGLIDRVALARLSERSPTFEGAFTPRRPGGYTLAASPPQPSGRPSLVQQSIVVAAGSPETDRTEADEEAMRLLAARTHGRFSRITDDLSAAARQIPDRSVRTADDVEEPLWDTRLALLAFVALITTEWIARKVRGLT